MTAGIHAPVVDTSAASRAFLVRADCATVGPTLRLRDTDDAWLWTAVPCLLDRREPPPTPRLRLDRVGAEFEVHGQSARLALGLAAFAEVTRQRPGRMIVATGNVLPNGVVAAVTFVETKLAKLPPDALCLVPLANYDEASRVASCEVVAVATLEAAINAVFGSGQYQAATSVGMLRARGESMRFEQRRWPELVGVADALATEAIGNPPAAFHARLLGWLALRRLPAPQVSWQGQTLDAQDLRTRLHAEIETHLAHDDVWPELRAQAHNQFAIEDWARDDALVFARGIRQATRGLALSAEGTATEHRRLLGTRMQLRTALAWRLEGAGLVPDARELAADAVLDAQEALRLARGADVRNDAARVRVYALGAVSAAHTLGVAGVDRDSLLADVMADLGWAWPGGVDEPTQDPEWGLMALLPALLLAGRAAEAVEGLCHALARVPALLEDVDRRRTAPRLSALVWNLEQLTGDPRLRGRVGPEGAQATLRQRAWWGSALDGGIHPCEAATEEQLQWLSQGDAGRHRLLSWCGDPLGYVLRQGARAGV